MAVIINTCTLYGATNYTNNWIGINLLVVLVSMSLIALVYSFSRFMPERIRGRINEATKTEITQSILSVLIIAILIGSAQVVCDTSASLGRTILMSSGVPASQASLSPFQYADYYVGNLALHTGLAMLTDVYSTTIKYDIQATVYGGINMFANNWLILKYFEKFTNFAIGGLVQIRPTFSADCSTMLRFMSDQYLLVFAPIITLVVGALMLQYLALPVMQYSAFVIVLPVAIAMRSISFAGINLRNTSNAVLAIAIAAYFIYPLMVLFDSYIMYWVFSPSLNPSYNYIHLAETITDLPINSFLSQTVTTSTGDLMAPIKFAYSGFSSSSLLDKFNILDIAHQTEQLVINIAELIFQGVVLFAINVAITVGFAMSLTKALNAGVEGAGSFWSSI